MFGSSLQLNELALVGSSMERMLENQYNGWQPKIYKAAFKKGNRANPSKFRKAQNV